MDVAARHGAMLHYKPVKLMGIWEISGAVPPPKRPPVRQRYRLVEIERVADFRGLDFNVKPAHFPVDATLADMTAIAIMQSGGDPCAYLGRVFAACWAKDMNIGDERVIEGLLDDAGFDGASMVAAAKADEIAAIRDRNTEAAIAADAVGVPAYVLDGEVFWGQDRVEHVDHALASGRKPIIAAA